MPMCFSHARCMKAIIRSFIGENAVNLAAPFCAYVANRISTIQRGTENAVTVNFASIIKYMIRKCVKQQLNFDCTCRILDVDHQQCARSTFYLYKTCDERAWTGCPTVGPLNIRITFTSCASICGQCACGARTPYTRCSHHTRQHTAHCKWVMMMPINSRKHVPLLTVLSGVCILQPQQQCTPAAAAHAHSAKSDTGSSLLHLFWYSRVHFSMCNFVRAITKRLIAIQRTNDKLKFV